MKSGKKPGFFSGLIFQIRKPGTANRTIDGRAFQVAPFGGLV